MKEIRFRAIYHLLLITSFLATLLGSAAFPIPVRAADQVVTNLNDSGDGSLRKAVSDVAAGEKITFGVTGTIYLSSQITIDKNLTIEGPGSASLTISGGNAVRIFNILNATVNISGLTIANGYAGNANGGGIFNFGGSLTVNNVIFTNNQTLGSVGNSGGAIYQNQGSLTITNSIFTGGAAYDGGAIEAANVPLMISNSTFASNTASDYGGAIRWGSGDVSPNTLTVLNSTFSGNHAARGSGINRVSSNLISTTDRIVNSTFSANTTTGLGGGVFSANGTLILTNNTFSANSASNGGGIYNSSANLSVINNTFSANSASIGGPFSGGGIYSQGGSVSLINTILANSPIGVDCYNDFGPWGPLLNNLIETGNCFAGDPSSDPQLSTLGDHGGPTQTFALLPNSPGIDGGDNLTCAAAPVNNLDQRGQPRDDWNCDIGAFEMQLDDSHVVTKLITGTGVYTFGPTRVKVKVGTQGALADLTVQETASDHPGSTGIAGGHGVGWGEYFTITPNIGANGTFSTTLTLPAQFTTDPTSRVCLFIDQHLWNCAADSWSHTPFNNVSRSGVTAFSQWAAGNDVSPTAVRLVSFRVEPLRSLGLLSILTVLLVFGFAAIIFVRRH
jgi:hypothetical protein